MSVFEVPTYVTTIPLPAALGAAAPLATYQDPNGDWWVAKGGVNGGVWRRATDVMRSRLYRNAAWTPSASQVLFTFDAAMRDDYTLYNTTTGIFTCPLTGWYRVTSNISVGTPTGSNNYGTATVLMLNHLGGGFVGWSQNNTDHYSTVGNMISQSILADLVPCTAGDQMQFQFNCGLAGVLGRVTSSLTFASFDYVGSG